MVTAGGQRVAVVRAKVRPPTVVALVRERVNNALDRIWGHRLGLVVGPAGSGKTTALAQFAASVDAPVAWYRAEASESDPAALLQYLEGALVTALDRLEGNWATLEQAVAALERWPGRRALLVVDDLHMLAGSAGERLLEKLVDYAPPALHVAVSSRSQPGFNLSRLRVSGDLLEVGADDLRFRAWEVEQLFRGFYREPLPPEDLASLTRRTEGWAAGLQLFHLATQGKPAEQRRRAVAALGSRSRLVRDYLARNVLDELPGELRDFLLGTCVLGHLTGPLCDRLLGRRGSRRVLEELGEFQVFTVELDDDGAYRYHEVLRSHLEAALVEQVGEGAARACYRRAGELLEEAGALPEALHAYCRAEERRAVDRLLGLRGEELAGGTRTWLDLLPPALLQQDPWLLLAEARRQLASGRLEAAATSYRRAEEAFGASTPAETCRRERQAVGAWLDPASLPAGGWGGWAGLVRAATRRDPLAAQAAAANLGGPEGRLAEGLAALLGGVLEAARTQLAAAAEHPAAGAPVAVGARLALVAADVLGGMPYDQGEVESIVEHAERLDLPWLTRIGRALLALRSGAGEGEADELRESCESDGDRWGSGLVGLVRGLGLPLGETVPVAALYQAAAAFHELDAGVLEALARSLAAVARARLGSPDADTAWRQAAAAAHAHGARAAEAIALLAGERSARAEALAAHCGLGWDVAARSQPAAPPDLGFAPTADPGTEVTIRCFGRFELGVGGSALDLPRLKPRCQALLHLLAMHGVRPVHREALVEAIWPLADAEAGMRNLQVAVSTLRRFLGPAAALAREGQSYRLDLPERASIDVVSFERACVEARATRARGDGAAAETALALALDLYRGDLLPEDGPAEWVVGPRDQFRAEVAEAAAALAELRLARGAAAQAAAACERGLRVDRYRDSLWRLLIEARERGGDQVAAGRARRDYHKVLEEMGVVAAITPAPRA